MFHNVDIFHPTYLIDKIPEISYLLSAALMLFLSDFILEWFLIQRLRRQTFIARTCVFLAYGLFLFPPLTAIGASLLRDMVLNPYQEWIVLLLIIFFSLFGILLNIRYNTLHPLRQWSVRQCSTQSIASHCCGSAKHKSTQIIDRVTSVIMRTKTGVVDLSDYDRRRQETMPTRSATRSATRTTARYSCRQHTWSKNNAPVAPYPASTFLDRHRDNP